MRSDSFLASLYTYPWDLADDGLDLALDRIADLAACGEVLLTPCYHRSEYYLPHNPRRPVYYGENGAVYFSPDMSRYEGTPISPRVSREVTDPAWFDRMVEAIRGRGLGFSAWMVYTFQNHLSERDPEFARHDAFGTPHVGALSTAPREVRDYFTALTAEILDRFRPDAVWVESLGRRGFSMPGKKRADMPERCRWLLSLCFNPASMAFADAAGLEAEPLRPRAPRRRRGRAPAPAPTRRRTSRRPPTGSRRPSTAACSATWRSPGGIPRSSGSRWWN